MNVTFIISAVVVLVGLLVAYWLGYRHGDEGSKRILAALLLHKKTTANAALKIARTYKRNNEMLAQAVNKELEATTALEIAKRAYKKTSV